MNAGAKERFVRIDIADSADEGLIQQQRFDARLAPLQIGGELSKEISIGSGPSLATRLGNSSLYSMQPNCRLSSNNRVPRSNVNTACVCLPEGPPSSRLSRHP